MTSRHITLAVFGLLVASAAIPELAFAAEQAASNLEPAPKPTRADYPSIAGVEPRILEDFDREVIRSYWAPERSWIDQRYANVQLPGEEIVAPGFEMALDWGLDYFLGYVGSWSATRRCRAATGTDPVTALGRHLAREWGNPGLGRKVSWPVKVVASRL